MGDEKEYQKYLFQQLQRAGKDKQKKEQMLSKHQDYRVKYNKNNIKWKVYKGYTVLGVVMSKLNCTHQICSCI